MSVHRLPKTGRLHAHESIKTLRKEFRTAAADVNTLYDVAQSGANRYAQSGARGTAPTGSGVLSKVRERAGWPQAGVGCGKGIRIGMIDPEHLPDADTVARLTASIDRNAEDGALVEIIKMTMAADDQKTAELGGTSGPQETKGKKLMASDEDDSAIDMKVLDDMRQSVGDDIIGELVDSFEVEARERTTRIAGTICVSVCSQIHTVTRCRTGNS